MPAAAALLSSPSSSPFDSGVFSLSSGMAASTAALGAAAPPRVRVAVAPPRLVAGTGVVLGTGVRLARVVRGASGSAAGRGGTASSASSCFTDGLLRVPRRPLGASLVLLEVRSRERESRGSSSSSSLTSIGFVRVPRRAVPALVVAAGVGVFARVLRVGGLVSASSVLEVAEESVAVRVRRPARAG